MQVAGFEKDIVGRKRQLGVNVEGEEAGFLINQQFLRKESSLLSKLLQ